MQSFWLLVYRDRRRLIPTRTCGRTSSLAAPLANDFRQALGLMETRESFSLSLTFKRHYKEKRKFLASMRSDCFCLVVLGICLFVCLFYRI